MNFELNEDQKMVRDMARRFAQEQILPIAAELDKTHRHPAEIVEQMAELGFMGMAVPVEFGGGGMDYICYALALAEISAACASVGVIMSVNNSLYCYPVMAYGTDEQKEKYLTPVASGQHLGCYGLTEAGAGSDAAALRMSAVPDGDGWILNGEKKFITNGNVADYCVLAAKTDKSAGYRGISTFVVNLKECEGFSLGTVEEKMGICASGTAELIFEDARVPGDALLGKQGDGFKQMLATLNGGRIGIASQALGIGRAVLTEALSYVKEREQFGKPIAALQAIQFKLADIAMELDAAELLILRAAYNETNGLPYEKAAAMAKCFAGDAAMRAAVEGVQILGGYGYTKDYAMERHMRDAKITQIYEGTNEVMRVVIASNLLKGK